jgi:hypothetical protein
MTSARRPNIRARGPVDLSSKMSTLREREVPLWLENLS